MFSAFVAQKDGDAIVREVRQISVDELGEGDAVIRVTWSCVNYKDGLATLANGKVARINPIIPGVDMAGEIVEPGDPGRCRHRGDRARVRPRRRAPRRLHRVRRASRRSGSCRCRTA